jgi:hypothetical protein
VRVFGRGAAGAALARTPRSAKSTTQGSSSWRPTRAWPASGRNRPAFATLERTGAATGAALAREEYGLTGRGVGIAVIDSGITSYHHDLYDGFGRRSGSSIVHFKDFTRPSARSELAER